MVEAFAISSDTFFYQMAVHLGVDRLAKWAHELGFGSPTGIDLPNEASGVIASTEWAHSQGRTGVFTGELAQAGIGQNVIAVTPLQLLNAYAALANGGHLMRPQIVLGEADAEGNLVERYEPEVLHEVAADPANLQTYAHRRPPGDHHRSRVQHQRPAAAGNAVGEDRDRRVRPTRRPGHPAVPLLVRRVPPVVAGSHRLSARGHHLHLSGDGHRQRLDRGREVLPPAVFRSWTRISASTRSPCDG